jgi:chemotaxis signal transduction protein
MTLKADPSLEESRKDILREASGLLQEGKQGQAAEPENLRSLLVFALGQEWYGVDMSSVRRVLRPAPVARVPGASPEVLGLMNCHGEVLCVLDPRKIFGTPGGEEERGEGRLVLVLHFGGKEAGILVDGVGGTAAREGRFVGILNVSMCLNP